MTLTAKVKQAHKDCMQAVLNSMTKLNPSFGRGIRLQQFSNPSLIYFIK